MARRVEIGGIWFYDAPIEAVTEEILDRAAKRLPCLAVTPNATMLHAAFHDEAFLELLKNADLVLPDGAGVVLAARLLKTPFLHGKLAGVELGESVVRSCARRGVSLYFFGGRDSVAKDAKLRLMRRYPTLSVAGVHTGFGFSLGAVARRIERSGAEIVFCCLGSPLQEKIGRYLADRLSLPVLCLGGSLDVYADRIRRAPRIFRMLSLEWLWRMLCEPRRFRGISSLFGFLCDALALKKAKKACNRHEKRL